MSITLYGSKPSPYVRRIRMLLHGTDFEFTVVNVYDDSGRSEYAKLTPIRKLPLLVDGDKTIFDSHVIADYLIETLDLEPVTLEQHNLISGVDSVTDSLIVLFMGKNSKLELSEDVLIFKLQYERIKDSLTWLEEKAKEGDFSAWNYATISLITLIDWVQFRDLYDLSDYPTLIKVRDDFRDQESAKATLPE